VQYDISFIHTGEVHIQKFGPLVAELDPTLRVNHVVDESLLIHAQKFGSDSWLETHLKAHLQVLSLTSKVIVVTCSSVGAIAENLGSLNGCKIQRIDKAMADYAIKNGKEILVMAALESTLAPTKALLEQSMKALGGRATLTFCHVENAWEYFLSGNMKQYYDQISKAIISSANKCDLIVLAQASMSEVENIVNVSIPVISSPKLGVKRAIDSL